MLPDTQTIGVVTASCAAIYSVFLVYFDWIREQYLPRWRQIYWVSLHLPFHLALVLFMHGFTQLIMWTKIFDVLNNDIRLNGDLVTDYDRVANSTSEEIANGLAEMVGPFFQDYGRANSLALLTFSTATNNITMLPNDIWSEHPDILDSVINLKPMGDRFNQSETYDQLNQSLVAMFASMYSALFETYGVEVTDELADNATYSDIILDPDFQTKVFVESLNRFTLVVCSYMAGTTT
jgi:hypothetical protein